MNFPGVEFLMMEPKFHQGSCKVILRRSHAVPGGDIYQKCVACAELHGVCLRAVANVVEKAPP